MFDFQNFSLTKQCLQAFIIGVLKLGDFYKRLKFF